MPHGGGGGRADAWRAINGSVREKDARVSSSFFFSRGIAPAMQVLKVLKLFPGLTR